MTRRTNWMVLALALSACSPSGQGELSEEARAAIEGEVEAALAGFSGARDRGDWAEVAAMYADDPAFVWYESGRIAYQSAAGVATALETVSEQYGESELTLIDPVITVLGPDAAHIGTGFEQQFGSGDRGFRYGGIMTIVMVRTDDGWKFLKGHTSSPARRSDD